MSFKPIVVLTSQVVVMVATVVLLHTVAEAEQRTRRNFYGNHNLMDGGASIPEGMNWTRHMVGEGGYVFDWVRGDYGQWVVDAMDRGLIPCLRIQECNGGCDPSPGYPAIVAAVIQQHLAQVRPEYSNRVIYFQLWNEPGDARDLVTPEVFADYLVNAHAAVHNADVHDVFRTMTPGQNGTNWWRQAIRHNPAVCQAFDVWATHPYPESYPPHYNHHDGVPYINQVKTIDSYLLDLDAVADECEKQGSPRRGFPVMITETAYGNRLGISYEGYPKTTRGPVCSTDGPCEFQMASQYNLAAFSEFWHKWPEIIAVHPFILNNWSWDHFAFVSRASGSRNDGPTPSWCPPEDIGAATPWPPGYSAGAQRCGLPDAPYPQYKALLDIPKPPPASLEPYRGPVGVIRGTIKRSDTLGPVEHATIYTDGYEFGGPSLFDGQFVIRDVPVGTYTLSVDKVGYESAVTQVNVREAEEVVVDFDLQYLGKVSKGIYFQNQGTCDGCDLFAPFLGQTFTVPPDVGFIKFAAAMPNVGNVTMKFSVLEGGPAGRQVGSTVAAFLEWGGEMIGAEWPGDGVPVEPNQAYFLKVERADGQGVYLYATDGNPHSDGMAFTGSTPHPNWDLFATVRGRTLPANTAAGALTGIVQDTANQPLAGAAVTAGPGGQTTVTGSDGQYLFTALPEGIYTVSSYLEGYLPLAQEGIDVFKNQTSVVDFTLLKDTGQDEPPTANLITNGDFSNELNGWSLWRERGVVNPAVNGAGQLHLSAVGHNAGMYQSFATGGAGTEITIDGFWATAPTSSQAQWAEVLIINGPATPVEGQDLNDSQSNVLMIYKNDTWTSRSGWSGEMRQTAPLAAQGFFIASGDTATIVLKSGNLQGVSSGTVFDDVVVRGSGAPPPVNQQPTAKATAQPTAGTAPLSVGFDASGSSDPDGDSLTYSWNFGDGAQGSGMTPSHSYENAGAYTVTLTVDDRRGGTDSDSFVIMVEPSSEPANLVTNGDFSDGLNSWSLWRERGAITPTVNGAGQLHLSAVGHNAGMYQSFATGGAGTEIAIDGFWATGPTSPRAQWGEVLVIDGPGTPIDGRDLNASQSNVVMIYKNDTWASPSGWSGDMRQTAPVEAQGSFIASGDMATIILKSGNPLGVSSGILFDDIVVRGSGAPLPVNQPPLAEATAAPSSGAAPLSVSFDASASSDPEGDSLTYRWDFGDGTEGAGISPSHTYSNVGPFTATLTVDDGKGGTDTSTVGIMVTEPGSPPPDGTEWDVRLDTLGVQVVQADVAPGTWYWKLIVGRFESDGEVLPAPGGGNESGGTHSIYLRALQPDGTPIGNQEAVVSWPNGNPTHQVSTWTKGAVDDFWGDFPMAGGWCPFFPDGPRGPYGARISGGPSDEVWGMGMPCSRHVSYRFAWKWTEKTSEQSKLTIHAGFGGPLSMQFVANAKPRLIKILDSFSAAPTIKQISPDTEIIGRAYLPHQPMDGDPIQRARDWWNASRTIIIQYPEIDYWEGYNEPIIHTTELMGWYAQFESERIRLLAEHGLKACIGNFSVGNPDLPLWPSFYPAIDTAKAHGGILGLHEYGTPMQQHFDDNAGEGWFCGRYRKLYRQFLIPNNKVIPLAITECGVDVVPPVGWKNHFTDEEYLDQLAWYDRVLMEDDYVMGATIFALEIPGWYSFDIAPIADRLAEHVAQSATQQP